MSQVAGENMKTVALPVMPMHDLVTTQIELVLTAHVSSKEVLSYRGDIIFIDRDDNEDDVSIPDLRRGLVCSHQINSP